MKNNMEKLINSIKNQAELFLNENGEFAPFGAFIRADDKITHISGYSQNCSSEEIYKILLKGVKHDLKDQSIRASAIALNGRYEKRNVLVIEIFLSIEDKYQIIYPYSISQRGVEFEEKV